MHSVPETEAPELEVSLVMLHPSVAITSSDDTIDARNFAYPTSLGLAIY